MVKLKDIAEKAGVTVATVSAALSGKGRVSPEKRERIVQLARALNYRPNSAARLLRKKPIVDVGFLIADQQVKPVPMFLDWCERYRRRSQLELTSSGGSEMALPHLFENGFAQGIVHIGYIGKAIRAFLAENPDFPFVAVNESAPFCVRSDFSGGARQVLQYFAALGHEKILFSCHDLDYDMHRQLHDGCIAASREFGLENRVKLVQHDIKGLPNVEVMRAMLDFYRGEIAGKNPPTAFFCGSLIAARALIQAASERGLNVPGDYCVVAMGDGDEAEMGYPALSTLSHDYRALASSAMLLLQSRINGTAPKRSDVRCDVEFVHRQSTAANSQKNKS